MKPLNARSLAASLALTVGLGMGMGIGLMPAAQAHDDAYLDTLATPHGGQLRMAGASHFELVLVKDSNAPKDNTIEVYVTDHAGTKIPTAGATASITLLGGKTKVSTALKPAGDNKLSGHAVYASRPDLKAVTKIKLAGQDEQQARFTPLAPRAADKASAPHEHQH